SYMTAIRVVRSEAYTYLICGPSSTISSVGSWSNSSRPCLTTKPEKPTPGNSAAATTTPAATPHIRRAPRLTKRLWSPRRIHFTQSGYVRGGREAVGVSVQWGAGFVGLASPLTGHAGRRLPKSGARWVGPYVLSAVIRIVSTSLVDSVA